MVIVAAESHSTRFDDDERLRVSWSNYDELKNTKIQNDSAINTLDFTEFYLFIHRAGQLVK